MDAEGRPVARMRTTRAAPFSHRPEMKKYSGELITTPHGSDKAIRHGTLSCVHCQRTWVHTPGSGKVRGWCGRCNGPICSAECAEKCVPLEQMIENIEHGRELDYRPISVNVLSDMGR